MKKVFEMLCKELGNAAGTLIMIIAFFTGYCSFFTKQMYTCPDIGVVCDNYSQFKDIYELIAEEILGISAITSKGIALCREKINYYGDTAIPFFCSETDVNVKNVNAALVSIRQ